MVGITFVQHISNSKFQNFLGKDIVAVDSPIGRLGLTVCYDLRFPELYQQLRFNHGAQVLEQTASSSRVYKSYSALNVLYTVINL